MSLYQCQKCHCVENTSCGFYHSRSMDIWPEDYRGKALCSECGPPTYVDGKPSKYGKWHGRFEKRIYPANSLYTDKEGNVRDKVTNKYSWEVYVSDDKPVRAVPLHSETKSELTTTMGETDPVRDAKS